MQVTINKLSVDVYPFFPAGKFLTPRISLSDRVTDKHLNWFPFWTRHWMKRRNLCMKFYKTIGCFYENEKFENDSCVIFVYLKFILKLIFSLFIELAQISSFTYDLCNGLEYYHRFICVSNVMTWVLDAINVMSWILSVITVLTLVLWLCSVDEELINSQGKSSLHGRCLRLPGTSLPQHVNGLYRLIWFSSLWYYFLVEIKISSSEVFFPVMA